MEATHKDIIVSELKQLSSKESQSKIAKKANVSTATISQMINNNHELIRDEMWLKVKINLRIDWGWISAPTTNLKKINQLLNAVQNRSISVCISHDAGAGKSHTFKLYERTYQNVIYIECKNYWTKKSYAKKLLTACGLDTDGTVENLIDRFINHMKGLNMPLIIIDQIDKLKDAQFDLFMDFYNELDGHCGFVLSGVPALRKRIERGRKLDKIGYREVYSRIGCKYISLSKIKMIDVANICKANGVTDEELINEIFNTCEGDLRRVKREVDKYFLLQNPTV